MPMTMTAVGFDGFEDDAADDEAEEEAAGAGAGGEAEGALGSVDADMSASGAGPRVFELQRSRARADLSSEDLGHARSCCSPVRHAACDVRRQSWTAWTS
jgi:hypothetical protein